MVDWVIGWFLFRVEVETIVGSKKGLDLGTPSARADDRWVV